MVARAADWMDDRDRDLFKVAAAARHRTLDALLPPLAMGGDNAPLWLSLAALLGLAGGRPRRVGARALGAFVMASVVTDVGLKRLTRRPRPPLDELLTDLGIPHVVQMGQPKSTSFPSGHAAAGMAFATGAVLEGGRAYAPLLLLAAAICYSRIYTGAHYPGDVAAGAIVGVGFATTADWSWIPARAWDAAGALLAAGRD